MHNVNTYNYYDDEEPFIFEDHTYEHNPDEEKEDELISKNINEIFEKIKKNYLEMALCKKYISFCNERMMILDEQKKDLLLELEEAKTEYLDRVESSFLDMFDEMKDKWEVK